MSLSSGQGSATLATSESAHLAELLDAQSPEAMDVLGFGVIGFDLDEIVVVYNAFESARAGIGKERVLGRNVFTDVAPCTNNFLVSQRYRDALEQGVDLDEQLDYVFTLRMAPTPVRLRLLATADAPRRYLVVNPT